MNTQNSQNLRNCMQSEVLDLCDSSVDRLLGRVVNLINSVRTYYAHQALTGLFSNLSPKLLRDIGLDDPQVQMRLFESNLNTEASIREMNRNRNLLR
jgi:hypothetical protein